MKHETEELIKLINSADDADRAVLTAFAILLEYFQNRETNEPPISNKSTSKRIYPSA